MWFMTMRYTNRRLLYFKYYYINKLNIHQARLVLRPVTICGR